MKRFTKGLSVVLDIGSGSVGGALVLFSAKTTKPKILKTLRAPILLPEEIDMERFTKAVFLALKLTLEGLGKSGLGTPEDVSCFLASPWAMTQTRTAKFSRNNSFKFTEKMAQDYIQKEIKNFENSYLEMFDMAGQKMKLLDHKYFRTKLNGYLTEKPFGQKAKSLELDLLISIAPAKLLEKIEYQIKKSFNLPVLFKSFIHSSFLALRDLFPNQTDFLMLDIAGELTDLSLIKRGNLSETVSFPLGQSFIISEVAEKFRKNKEEAQTIISLFLENKLEESLSNKVAKLLEDASKVWLKSFDRALAKVSPHSPLPETIFVAVDQDFASFFENVIKSDEWGQLSLAHKKFNVIILNNRILSTALSVSERVAPDPFLGLESFYISRI